MTLTQKMQLKSPRKSIYMDFIELKQQIPKFDPSKSETYRKILWIKGENAFRKKYHI